jgi:hypothetical protein
MRRRGAVVLGVLALLSVGVPVAAADSTPPVGTIEIYSTNVETQIIDVRLSFSDPESGIVEIIIWCDSGPEAAYPAGTTRALIPFFDQSLGGCSGFGDHWIWVQARNGDGLPTAKASSVSLGPWVHVETPVSAVTGQPFTIQPTFAPGYDLPVDAACQWEFRWGSDKALFDPHVADGTFGGLLFEGPASQGFCGEWTFTLPYVPLPRFHVTFSLGRITGEEREWGAPTHFGNDERGVVTATVGSTDPHIRTSNLPLVYVLPDEYIHTIGEPTTYRAYARAGATIKSTDRWIARLEGTQHAFFKTGGSSFTFTPDRLGEWVVGWDGGPGRTYLIAGYYDPPVKRADTTDPYTTTPTTSLNGGSLGAMVAATVQWTGGDSGWGVASYRLQRSTNGGGWTTIANTTSKKSITSLVPATSYRFRVRATDKAGNVGSWDYGPTLRASLVEEAGPGTGYSEPWLVAVDRGVPGSTMRVSAVAGAAVTRSFYGRGIAIVGPRGPAYGQARIHVDGKLVATIDQHATVGADGQILFVRNWTKSGHHAVRVTVVGTAGHPLVAIDGFVLLT